MEAKDRKKQSVKIKIAPEIMELFKRHYVSGDINSIRLLYKEETGEDINPAHIRYIMDESQSSSADFVKVFAQFYTEKERSYREANLISQR